MTMITNQAVYCEICGRIIDGEYNEVGGKHYCDDCMEKHFVRCENCGEWTMIPFSHDVNTCRGYETWCDDCISDDAFYCDHCEEYYSNADYSSIDVIVDYSNNDTETWCSSCADNDTFYCERCNNYYSDDLDYYNVHSNGYEETWCSDCLDENARQCEHCEEWFDISVRYPDVQFYPGIDEWFCDDCASDRLRQCGNCGAWHYADNMIYDDGSDEWYCEDCAPEECGERVIYEYHNYPCGHRWHRMDNEDRRKVLHMGTELEIDDGGESHSNAEAIINAMGMEVSDYNVIAMHDGSLNNGFELISQPASLQYHTSEYKWEEAMKKAVSLGYRSHDPGTCGLHVHIDRIYFNDAFEDPEQNFVILIQNNQDWLKQFSRRKRWGYCNFMSSRTFEVDDFKGEKERAAIHNLNYLVDSYRGHNAALNFCGNNTIEIRFFNGTLKHSTFIASLQLVEMMSYAVKHLRKEQICNINLKWFKRFAHRKGYKEFEKYLGERGIIAA